MSAEATAWAWQQRVNSGAKMLLLCLADQSDTMGRCQATAYELSAQCGYSRSTVFKHLTALIRAGFLERSATREATRQAAHHYQLVI